MSLTSLIITAAESSEGDPAIPAVVVGGIALGILLTFMAILLMFGAGREHS
jgi:hypothetical protein